LAVKVRAAARRGRPGGAGAPRLGARRGLRRRARRRSV